MSTNLAWPGFGRCKGGSPTPDRRKRFRLKDARSRIIARAAPDLASTCFNLTSGLTLPTPRFPSARSDWPTA